MSIHPCRKALWDLQCQSAQKRHGYIQGSLVKHYKPRGSNNSFRPTCTGLYTDQLLPTEVLTYPYILQAVCTYFLT